MTDNINDKGNARHRAFREVENSFQVLRQRFRDREISRREFIDQLKKLRLRDDRGRFWMIGAQTGHWYFFDGKEWVQAEPPADTSARKKCYVCGLDNEPEALACARCGESLERAAAACPNCGAPLENPFQKCPACSRETEAAPFAEEAPFQGGSKRGEELVLRRFGPLSVFYAFGGLGLIAGIIAGAFAGASGSLASFAARLPDFLATLHGTLMGGIVFGVAGGVAGFVALGLLGFLLALVFNLTASVSGGVRVSARRPAEPAEEKPSEN
jgi:hypothetical protein